MVVMPALNDQPRDAEPVRLALIGFGYWGPNYARVLNELALAATQERQAGRIIARGEQSTPSLDGASNHCYGRICDRERNGTTARARSGCAGSNL